MMRGLSLAKPLRSAFLLLLLLFILGGALQKSLAQIEALRSQSRAVLWVPPSPFLALASLGQKPLVSDLLVIGAVQYYVRPRFERDPATVKALLEAATDLDPRNYGAWYIPAHLLSFTPEDVEVAIQVLKNGLEKNPSEWRIPFYLSLKHYDRREYAEAQHYAELAAAKEAAPRNIKRFPAFLYSKKGDIETAIEYLSSLYESAATPDEKEFIVKRIEWMKAKFVLEKAVASYKSRWGRLPSSPDELVKSGLLDALPKDPFGRGFKIHPTTGEVEGK